MIDTGTGTGIVKRTVKKRWEQKKGALQRDNLLPEQGVKWNSEESRKRDDTIPAVSPTSRTSSACHHGHRHRRGAYSSWKRDFRGCAVQEVLAYALPTTNQELPENLRKE